MNKCIPPSQDQENALKTLKILEEKGSPTQRELSTNLNLSLGKINFVMRSLVQKGWVKAKRFKNSNKKSAYFYYLTPKGMEQKAHLARNFLNRKLEEYSRLKEEIQMLQNDLAKNSPSKETLTSQN